MILLAGLVDDLWTKKVHNALIVGAFVVSLISLMLFAGFESLPQAFIGSLLAFVLMLPFYVFKVVGGGDFKLFMVFGFATNATIVPFVLVYTLPWAVIFGVFKVLLSKERKVFFQNLKDILTMKKPKVEKMHDFPFTVPLFFGWMSYITWGNAIF